MLRPAETYQIHLRPADFFTRNPALDVPSTRNEASVLVPCCGGNKADVAAEKSGSVQESPLNHLQGSSKGDEAPADKGERRLSKVITGLFKSRGKEEK